MNDLWRVVTPYCVAGVIVHDGVIVETAPILKRWRGRSCIDLKLWAQLAGYEVKPCSGASRTS